LNNDFQNIRVIKAFKL